MIDAKMINQYIIRVIAITAGIFVCLKLLGLTHWSWWWALSPIWLMMLMLLFVPIVGIIYVRTKVRRIKNERNNDTKKL